MELQKSLKWIFLIFLIGLFLTGCATSVGTPPDDGDDSVSETEDKNKNDQEFKIVTLLPKDAIPSIDNPRFHSVEEADQEYDPEEIVLGVVFDGEATRDQRLPTKEFVVGVSMKDESVAYAFSTLNDEPIVNDIVANVPVLVTFDAENASGAVFERRIDGKILTFRQVDGFQIVDDETGTLWDGVTGDALEGELLGSQLERVKSTLSFWFGWKDFYPETRVYGLEPD